MEMDYKSFASGSDIRGVAVETKDSPVTLTDSVVYNIACGFAKFLGAPKKRLKIAVGHDSRISADRIKTAVISALSTLGCDTFDCSLSSTPAMFMACADGGMDAAVQITASHHPFDRNGLKFFTKNGGLESADIKKILENAQAGGFETAQTAGQNQKLDYMKRYAQLLRNIIRKALNSEKPLDGYRFAVDAGNGAGGFYATEVLAPLGADVSGSVYLEPDGMFPNHVPNPEDKTAMASISAATIAAKADLGIIFDTDVDRAACVDSGGSEINRNRLVALAAAIALEGNKGGTIVTDSVTSDGLKKFIENDLGGVHHRFKRGYKNVINEAIRLNNEGVNSPLAIETSGHAALRENYFLDDGAYLITRIVIKLVQLRAQGKTLSQLIEKVALPKEESERRYKITKTNFKEYGMQVLAGLECFAKSQNNWQIADDNREGLRVSCDNGSGWFLLRLSVHDPIMPLNIESDKNGGVAEIETELTSFFESCEGLAI